MEDFWYGMEMEWKKIASMEYGKNVFHSIPCPGAQMHTVANYWGDAVKLLRATYPSWVLAPLIALRTFHL